MQLKKNRRDPAGGSPGHTTYLRQALADLRNEAHGTRRSLIYDACHDAVYVTALDDGDPDRRSRSGPPHRY